MWQDLEVCVWVVEQHNVCVEEEGVKAEDKQSVEVEVPRQPHLPNRVTYVPLAPGVAGQNARVHAHGRVWRLQQFACGRRVGNDEHLSRVTARMSTCGARREFVWCQMELRRAVKDGVVSCGVVRVIVRVIAHATLTTRSLGHSRDSLNYTLTYTLTYSVHSTHNPSSLANLLQPSW